MPKSAKPQKRAENKARNRDEILSAARAVFLELGYEATNIRDIIRRTKLASGTFYNYFKTKEEVFAALHDLALSRFKPHLKMAFEEANGDFEKFIYSAFHSYFKFKSEETLINLQSDKLVAGARHYNSPESQAIFDEIAGYLNHFCSEDELCHIEGEMLIAACVGIAQELGIRQVNLSIKDIATLANFATNFVIGGINNLRSQPKS